MNWPGRILSFGLHWPHTEFVRLGRTKTQFLDRESQRKTRQFQVVLYLCSFGHLHSGRMIQTGKSLVTLKRAHGTWLDTGHEQLIFPVFKCYLILLLLINMCIYCKLHCILFMQQTLTCTAWPFNNRSNWTVRNADAVSSSLVAWAPCLGKTRRKARVKSSFKIIQS